MAGLTTIEHLKGIYKKYTNVYKENATTNIKNMLWVNRGNNKMKEPFDFLSLSMRHQDRACLELSKIRLNSISKFLILIY